VEAADRLVAAASKALVRGDAPAAARLLERAEALLTPEEPARDELLPFLGAALFEAGRVDEARRVLDEAIERAPDRRLRARAEIERELVRLEVEPDAASERGLAVANEAQPALEDAGDDHGVARTGLLRGELAWRAGRVAEADDAWSKASERASRTGDQREVFELIGWRGLAAALGPMPVDEAIARCDGFRAAVRSSPLATASTLNPLALLHAMKGDLATSDRLLTEASELLDDLGGLGSGVSHLEAFARLLAGRPELVEERLRADVETLSSMSEGSVLATTTALLAQAVYDQGRLDEAGELALNAAQGAAEEDMLTQTTWRAVRAKVLAQRGDCAEAETLAREAVALLEPTDLLSQRGDAMLALAYALRVCERLEEADSATRDGLAMYELKGNQAAAERSRSLLAKPQAGG
jgi:tetratricopeptide (TPR) repeat protein